MWTDETKKSGGLQFSFVAAEVREQILNCCLDHSFTPYNDRKLSVRERTSNDPALSERPGVTSQAPGEFARIERGAGHKTLGLCKALAAAGRISRVADQQAGPSKGVKKPSVQPKVHEVKSNTRPTITQLTQGGFRIGATPQGSRSVPEAWKKMVGQKPVPARLATLPDSKLRWSALLTSTLFQATLAVVLVAIPMFFPDRLVTKIEYEVTPLATPDTSVPLPKKAPPVAQARVQPAPKPVEAPPPPQHVAKLLMPERTGTRRSQSRWKSRTRKYRRSTKLLKKRS